MTWRIGGIVLALAVGMLIAPSAWAGFSEARFITPADIAGMGGTDFDGGTGNPGGFNGDYLLRNDKVEVVIMGFDSSADFGIPIGPEALATRGVIIDAGTRGDKNDQLSEISHVVNASADNSIFYTPDVFPPSISNGPTSASITIFGIVFFPPFPDGAVIAETTYTVEDGEDWVSIRTTVTNFLPFPVNVFQITDVDILAGGGRLAFQPFPFRGHKPPPLDLSSPAGAFGLFQFLSSAGNNGPDDGPTNNDGSPSGEVSYTIVPVEAKYEGGVTLPNLLQGFGDNEVVGVGNAFTDPGALLGPFQKFIYERNLVIANGNSVEASLTLAEPLIGLGTRAEFSGRVVDSVGDGVPDAHIFFENTVPGFQGPPATFITEFDDDQNGTIDSFVPVDPGDPTPTTHVVTDANGNFSVKLPALADPNVLPSDYTAFVQAPNRGTGNFGPLTVDLASIGDSPNALVDWVVSDTGTLSFTVNDTESGLLTPAKITIVGTPGTDDPDFGSQYLSLRNFPGLSKNGGEDGLDIVRNGNSGNLVETFAGVPALNYSPDADGTGTLELAPGSYIAFATRGLEYSLDAKEFTIGAGQTTHLAFGIRQVVDTTGFVSMDFHVHSVKSFDSSTPTTDRVTSFLAEGVDVIVATDHDYITDYATVIGHLGAGDEIASIIGNELTGNLPVPADPSQGACAGDECFPEGIGHWNAWPLSVIPNARQNGAPHDAFITPGTAIDRMRGMDSLPLGKNPDTATLEDWLPAIQAGEPGTVGELLPPDPEVVMFNHPRAGLAGLVVIGMFNALAGVGYDPNTPIFLPPNVGLFTPSLYNKQIVGPAGTDTDALSFDAIELMNGGDLGGYFAVRDDWCSLLDQDINKTGTAVSDSHRAILESAGFARSYVASSTDLPAAIDEDELTDAVKAMQLTGTSGPFIRFSIKDDFDVDSGLGETVVVTGEKVVLKIRVEAAPWIPVEEVRIYRNCELFETIAVKSSAVLGKVLRFNKSLPRTGIDDDAYFFVEAGVRLDGSGNPESPGLLTTLQTIEPGIVPLGFTNPIFVDRQGDGYTPPGL
jgi:hypothetical protein